MSAYSYFAINAKGKKVKGILEADSARQAREQLREQGLTPTEVTEVSGRRAEKKAAKNAKAAAKPSFSRRTRKAKLSVTELAMVTRQLATLIAAGTPLEECLRIVGEQSEKAKTKRIVLAVRSQVLEGHSLANAMKQFPHAFSQFFCSSVIAGEQSGHLEIVLERLADYVEQQQAVRQKIQQALIYPILMSAVSVLIVIFLLIYVVPKIIDAFQNTHQSLPAATVVLLWLSHFLKVYGIYLLIVLVIALFFFARAMRLKLFRFRVHKFLLRIPMIGKVIRLINTGRYARTFSVLTQAGVPALEAMRYSADVVTSLPIVKALKKAADRVHEGANINFALKQAGYMPMMSVYLIASGEASGRLADMLERVANNQDREVSGFIDVSLRLFEPALIIVMGAVVLFIVLAVMLPVFSLDQFTG